MRQSNKSNTSYFIRHIIAILAICSCIFWFCESVFAEDLSSPEYAIKAAFLYNFGKYVDWPEQPSSKIHRPFFRICIQGQDPFGVNLKKMEGKTVRSQTIQVDNIDIFEDAKNFESCHILFISRSEKHKLSDILTKIHGFPVLTVTDLDDTSNHGSIINLITISDKVRFQIDLGQARRDGIKISSQLLKLATQVME